MNRPARVRVLIAEDDPGVRDALASLIEHHEDLELAAVAADATEAVERAQSELPDVALIDIRMPGGGCVAAVRGIAACSPHTKVITLSASMFAPEMPESAVVGHLVKGSSIESIVETVKRAAEA